MVSEESVEITAPSVDEAIIVGLTRLGVTRAEVNIEILEEERRGFLLGIGARHAHVRLTLRPAETEVPTELDNTVTDSISTIVESEPEVVVASVELSPPSAPKTVIPPEPRLPAELRVPPEIVEEPQLSKQEVEPVVSPVEATPKSRRSQRRTTPSEAREVSSELDRESVEAAALEVAEHLLPDLKIQVSLKWKQEDRPTLWVSLRGRDADALVGPRAQTLNALQYLFRTIIHRKAEGDFNLVVDADGYRRRRRRSLESLAQRMAEQALSTGRKVHLRPMPANERRVVHMTLRKDDRVRTESSGSGRRRAITVIPKRD